MAMEYAVIKVNGKQYKVSEGDLLTLDRIDLEGKKTITFDQVLMIVNDAGSNIGKPTINGAKVEASFVEDKKGEKIRVSKFKAKSRYRKTIGFRAQKSIVKIDNIDLGSKKVEKETEKTIKTTSKDIKK